MSFTSNIDITQFSFLDLFVRLVRLALTYVTDLVSLNWITDESQLRDIILRNVFLVDVRLNDRSISVYTVDPIIQEQLLGIMERIKTSRGV